MSKHVSVAIVILFIIGFVGMAFVLLGRLPAAIFTLASVGGFALWLTTTYRTRIRTDRLIVPYLVAVILFVVHVYEEYITHFEVALFDITGIHVMQRDFLTVAAFAAPIIWITGAILVIKRTDLGYYFLSFFYVAMMIAELSHYVFPFLEDGTFHYVSGMYTAALPLLPAGYGFYLTVREIRLERRRRGSSNA